MAAADTGGSSATANSQLTILADELFDFDPTVDPTATAATNAAAIGANAQTNLGSQCGTVSVSGATVTVTFGPLPGCTLIDGSVVAGTVELTVSDVGATTTIALTLTDVSVNGEALAGTASFATTNGSTFTVTTNLIVGTKTDVASLTVAGAVGSLTISGTSTVTESGVTSKLSFDDLTLTKGECYATGGTLIVTTGGIGETVTFDADTPMTGQVSVTVGKRTTTTTLPTYGSCPNSGASEK